MRRTQIQLPDSLYNRLKKLARSQETTLSEVLRRAGEYLLSIKSEPESSRPGWQAPEPVDLGRVLVEEQDWRLQANVPEGEGENAQR
jgi:hypothetical protein